MTERFSTKKLVLSALFAALACVATMSIRIPTPGTGGYIHPGDAIVILCGVFLDPVCTHYLPHQGSGSVLCKPYLSQVKRRRRESARRRGRRRCD